MVILLAAHLVCVASLATDAGSHSNGRAAGSAVAWTPDIFLLGEQKAGSTALYDLMATHPKVHTYTH